MNQDELLRQAAALAREEEAQERSRLDERWDRLAAGELTAEELEQLRTLAAESPEAAAAFEAFRPLGEDFEAELVGRLQRRDTAPSLEEPAPSSETPRPARVLPFRGRRWLGGLTAAAAVAAVLLLMPRPVAMAPLPAYEMSFAGGARELRSDTPLPEEAPRLRPGDRLEMLLRPSIDATGPVTARAFAARGEEVRPWPSEPQVAPSGAVRLVGVLGQDFELPPGEWDLYLVAGRPDSLPEPREVLTGEEGSWRWGRQRVRIEP